MSNTEVYRIIIVFLGFWVGLGVLSGVLSKNIMKGTFFGVGAAVFFVVLGLVFYGVNALAEYAFMWVASGGRLLTL